MGRQAKNPTGKSNYLLLADRARAAMTANIAWDAGGAIPSAHEVARAIATRRGEESSSDFTKKLTRQIKDYLAGPRRPNADMAFDIGEALADIGCDWMHGLAMVDGAAGHRDDVIGAFATTIYEHLSAQDILGEDGTAMLDDFYSMIHTCDDLWLETNVDTNPDILLLHRRADLRLADMFSAYWATNAISLAERKTHPDLPIRRVPEGAGSLNFIRREVAKRACRQVAAHRMALRSAWKIWRSQRDTNIYGPSEWVSVALVVARENQIDLSKKSELIALTIGQWFSNLVILDDTPIKPWVMNAQYHWPNYVKAADPETFTYEDLLSSLGNAEKRLSGSAGEPFLHRMLRLKDVDPPTASSSPQQRETTRSPDDRSVPFTSDYPSGDLEF